MNQAGYVTLVGYVAREPNIRQTKEGTLVADMRVGTSSRFFDKQSQTWRDGDTSYFSVICWRRLATAAKASLRKGEPVIVRGRFRTRSYQGRDGVARTEVEVTADAFGHDLTRGVATFINHGRPRDLAAGQKPEESEAQHGDDENLDQEQDEAQYDAAREDDDPGGDEAPGAASGLPGGPPMTGAPAGFVSDNALARADVVVSELLNESYSADLSADGELAPAS
jgi:single-strand DNA-binding protein